MMTMIQEDAPHPLSYRPDLPLRSEMENTEQRLRDRLSAAQRKSEESSGRARRFEHELEEVRDELRQIKAKSA